MFDIPSILESIAADVKIGGMTWDQAAMELRKTSRNCFCVEDAKSMINDYI